MNELLNKTINVAEIKINNGNIKIVDEKGLTYTIWETKKSGDKTVAYKTYEGLGNIMGKSLEIGYDEKDIPDSQGKYRNIKTLKIAPGDNSSPSGVVRPNSAQTGLKAENSSQKPDFLKTSSSIKPDEVQNHIRWCNSLNNASLIIAHHKGETNIDGIINILEKLANQIYKLEPIEEERQTLDQHKEMYESVLDGQREDQAENYEENVQVPF